MKPNIHGHAIHQVSGELPDENIDVEKCPAFRKIEGNTDAGLYQFRQKLSIRSGCILRGDAGFCSSGAWSGFAILPLFASFQQSALIEFVRKEVGEDKEKGSPSRTVSQADCSLNTVEVGFEKSAHLLLIACGRSAILSRSLFRGN